jgi:hypothetical protein
MSLMRRRMMMTRNIRLMPDILLHCENKDNDGRGNESLSLSGTGMYVDSAVKRFGQGSFKFTNSSTTTLEITDFDDLGNDEFTFDCWININNKSNQFIFFKWGVQGYYSFVFQTSNNKLLFAYSTNGTSISFINGATPIANNTWTHVAVTRDAEKIYLFVNGVKDAEASETGAFANVSSKVCLGCCSEQLLGAYSLSGNMDEVRFIRGVCAWDSDFTPNSVAY